MKKYFLMIALFVAGGASAQVSFNAGSSTLKGFGVPTWYTGFHVGVEIPRDDAMTIFGRYTHLFSRAGELTTVFGVANDFNTTPYIIDVTASTATNFNIFEGGTRYYLGDGFDFGWAGYGGSNFMLIYNNIKMRYSDFDETKYTIDENSNREGAFISFGMGLSGGVKYTMPRFGTLYTDFSMGYLLFWQASNQSVYTGNIPRLFFGMNIGYRRDLFW